MIWKPNETKTPGKSVKGANEAFYGNKLSLLVLAWVSQPKFESDKYNIPQITGELKGLELRVRGSGVAACVYRIYCGLGV